MRHGMPQNRFASSGLNRGDAIRKPHRNEQLFSLAINSTIEETMKLIFSNILAVVLAATLSACGGGDGDVKPETTKATADASTLSPKDHAVTLADYSGSVRASPGCGRFGFNSGEYIIYSGGLRRRYLVSLPSDYNQYKPYKVIVGFHWRGGTAEDVAYGNKFYGLKDLYQNNAIYVAPDGIDNGWPNIDGRDIQFIRDMVGKLKQELCIDEGHVYANGFSYGGMMTYAVGCEMGDIFRVIAPTAGALRTPSTPTNVPGCGQSQNTVAVMMFHGRQDPVVPISWGYQARDMMLQKNSCSANTVPVGNNGCVLYTGCSRQTVWCEFDGEHSPPSFYAQEMKIFFDIVN